MVCSWIKEASLTRSHASDSLELELQDDGEFSSVDAGNPRSALCKSGVPCP